MVTIFSFCLAGISSEISATCSAVVTSQVHPEPSLLDADQRQLPLPAPCVPLTISKALGWAHKKSFLGLWKPGGGQKSPDEVAKVPNKRGDISVGFSVVA